jgi:hypothetical protein
MQRMLRMKLANKNLLRIWSILGGVGGALWMSKTSGATTVDIIPRIRICTLGVNVPTQNDNEIEVGKTY